MADSKRKHVATGRKAPGGSRPGAGRKPGSTNVLEYGEVKAVKVAGLRVPVGAPQEVKALADRAQQRIIDAMECKVHYLDGNTVLKAATRLREEICGPLTQKVQVSGLESLTDEQLKARLEALRAKDEES